MTFLASFSCEAHQYAHCSAASTICVFIPSRSVQEGDANGGNDMEGSSDSGDEAGEHGDSAPESDSGDTIQNLETVLKQMEATPVEPDSQPAGPLHGLELAELSAEQQDIQIKDTDELTQIGRVASVVDGIIVVKVCPTSTSSSLVSWQQSCFWRWCTQSSAGVCSMLWGLTTKALRYRNQVNTLIIS